MPPKKAPKRRQRRNNSSSSSSSDNEPPVNPGSVTSSQPFIDAAAPPDGFEQAAAVPLRAVEKGKFPATGDKTSRHHKALSIDPLTTKLQRKSKATLLDKDPPALYQKATIEALAAEYSEKMCLVMGKAAPGIFTDTGTAHEKPHFFFKDRWTTLICILLSGARLKMRDNRFKPSEVLESNDIDSESLLHHSLNNEDFILNSTVVFEIMWLACNRFAEPWKYVNSEHIKTLLDNKVFYTEDETTRAAPPPTLWSCLDSAVDNAIETAGHLRKTQDVMLGRTFTVPFPSDADMRKMRSNFKRAAIDVEKMYKNNRFNNNNNTVQQLLNCLNDLLRMFADVQCSVDIAEKMMLGEVEGPARRTGTNRCSHCGLDLTLLLTDPNNAEWRTCPALRTIDANRDWAHPVFDDSLSSRRTRILSALLGSFPKVTMENISALFFGYDIAQSFKTVLLSFGVLEKQPSDFTHSRVVKEAVFPFPWSHIFCNEREKNVLYTSPSILPSNATAPPSLPKTFTLVQMQLVAKIGAAYLRINEHVMRDCASLNQSPTTERRDMACKTLEHLYDELISTGLHPSMFRAFWHSDFSFGQGLEPRKKLVVKGSQKTDWFAMLRQCQPYKEDDPLATTLRSIDIFRIISDFFTYTFFVNPCPAASSMDFVAMIRQCRILLKKIIHPDYYPIVDSDYDDDSIKQIVVDLCNASRLRPPRFLLATENKTTNSSGRKSSDEETNAENFIEAEGDMEVSDDDDETPVDENAVMSRGRHKKKTIALKEWYGPQWSAVTACFLNPAFPRIRSGFGLIGKIDDLRHRKVIAKAFDQIIAQDTNPYSNEKDACRFVKEMLGSTDDKQFFIHTSADRQKYRNILVSVPILFSSTGEPIAYTTLSYTNNQENGNDRIVLMSSKSFGEDKTNKSLVFEQHLVGACPTQALLGFPNNTRGYDARQMSVGAHLCHKPNCCLHVGVSTTGVNKSQDRCGAGNDCQHRVDPISRGVCMEPGCLSFEETNGLKADDLPELARTDNPGKLAKFLLEKMSGTLTKRRANGEKITFFSLCDVDREKQTPQEMRDSALKIANNIIDSKKKFRKLPENRKNNKDMTNEEHAKLVQDNLDRPFYLEEHYKDKDGLLLFYDLNVDKAEEYCWYADKDSKSGNLRATPERDSISSNIAAELAGPTRAGWTRPSFVSSSPAAVNLPRTVSGAQLQSLLLFLAIGTQDYNAVFCTKPRTFVASHVCGHGWCINPRHICYEAKIFDWVRQMCGPSPSKPLPTPQVLRDAVEEKTFRKENKFVPCSQHNPPCLSIGVSRPYMFGAPFTRQFLEAKIDETLAEYSARFRPDSLPKMPVDRFHQKLLPIPFNPTRSGYYYCHLCNNGKPHALTQRELVDFPGFMDMDEGKGVGHFTATDRSGKNHKAQFPTHPYVSRLRSIVFAHIWDMHIAPYFVRNIKRSTKYYPANFISFAANSNFHKVQERDLDLDSWSSKSSVQQREDNYRLAALNLYNEKKLLAEAVKEEKKKIRQKVLLLASKNNNSNSKSGTKNSKNKK